MKRGTVVASVLLALAGTITGKWVWRDWKAGSSASYDPEPLSQSETTFLLTAHRFLESQISADGQAATYGHFESVRTFAQGAAADHRNEANRRYQEASATNDDGREYASKLLPVLKKHLKRAEELQQWLATSKGSN